MRGGTTFLGIHMPLGGQGSQLQVPSMRRSPPPPSMLVTWIPLGGTPDGFRESARHVPVLSWVAAEISAFPNHRCRCIRHPLGCGGAGQWGWGWLEGLQLLEFIFIKSELLWSGEG